MAETLTLHARSWFSNTQGSMAHIDSEQLPPGPPDGSDLINRQVRIDGIAFTVKGVQHCMVNHGDTDKRCPQGYGLLVKAE